MPYILNGSKDLISYWNTLGRPCGVGHLAQSVKQPRIAFIGAGRDPVSFSCQYGEIEAQDLASALGTTVANVTTNGGQILI